MLNIVIVISQVSGCCFKLLCSGVVYYTALLWKALTDTCCSYVIVGQSPETGKPFRSRAALCPCSHFCSSALCLGSPPEKSPRSTSLPGPGNIMQTQHYPCLLLPSESRGYITTNNNVVTKGNSDGKMADCYRTQQKGQSTQVWSQRRWQSIN